MNKKLLFSFEELIREFGKSDIFQKVKKKKIDRAFWKKTHVS